MNTRSCQNCGEPLPASSRADRTTCSMRCHVAAWRARKRADLAAAVPKVGEPTPLPSAGVVVVTSPPRPDGDVATQLALWLADVAVEAVVEGRTP